MPICILATSLWKPSIRIIRIDGCEVVVKVTRPDIRQQILQDFEILEWLGAALEKRLEAARALHLSEIIQDYRQIILNELDLTLEADNTRLSSKKP